MEAQEQEALIQMEALKIETASAEETRVTEDPSPPNLEEVEEIIGYKFKNKLLLEQAFTHSSYNSDDKSFCYERLEYVGDAVLNLLITKEQYFLYPRMAPGGLTRLRAANVDTEKLARVAIKHGLHRYLRHKKPILGAQILQFKKEIEEYPLHSNGVIDAPKDLADIVESTIGAIFIDSDSSIDTVWKVAKGLLEPLISPDTIQLHPVTQLYEFCQKRNMKVKFIDMWNDSMTFHVMIDDILVGRGMYSTKKEIAQNRAAKNALDNIGRILRNHDDAANDNSLD